MDEFSVALRRLVVPLVKNRSLAFLKHHRCFAKVSYGGMAGGLKKEQSGLGMISLLLLVLPLVGPPLVWGVAWQKVTFPRTEQLQNDEVVGPLYGSFQVGQSFFSPSSGLYRIDLLLGTYARRNTRDILFHLLEAPDSQKELATIRFNAREVEDNAYFSLVFPPVGDSANKTLFFYLESPESTSSNSITIRSTSEDLYPEGMMYVNGTPKAGDLAFAAYYKGNPLEAAALVLQRLTANQPYFWGDRNFYLLLATLYLSLYLSFVYRIIISPREEEPRDDPGHPTR